MIGPYRPVHMVFIQLHIFQNDTSGWHMDEVGSCYWCEYLPTNPKGPKLQKGPLKALKNIHKALSSSIFLLNLAQGCSCPFCKLLLNIEQKKRLSCQSVEETI